MQLIKFFPALRSVATAFACVATFPLFAQDAPEAPAPTKIVVSLPENPVEIAPTIYGQMLEDCDDRVIYDGAVGKNGEARPHVDRLLRDLEIPVVRWPGGTFVLEYQWERGVGPVDERPTVPVRCWGGVENHRFGTDEFLAWCERVDTAPYINLNANLHPDPEIGGSLEKSLAWIEYVVGDASTPGGQKRAKNGRVEPYDVRYWCVGNEEWGGFGEGVKLNAAQYAALLDVWATAIRARFPDLELLGVGHKAAWNETVLHRCGEKIDWLTQHYYVTAKIVDGKLVSPDSTLFAPAQTEAHLRKLAEIVEATNASLNRKERPIRLSVDEWNCRHSVSQSGSPSRFTRQDARRLYDCVVVAGTLNAFVRTSPTVAMGTYIFPVNGHGVVKTVGENDAYPTALYPIFQTYRQKIVGVRCDAKVDGPGVRSADVKFALEGDATGEKTALPETLTYLDAVAATPDATSLNIVVVNRSATEAQVANVELPEGCVPVSKSELVASGIDAANDAENRDAVVLKSSPVDAAERSFAVAPCGFLLLECRRDAVKRPVSTSPLSF